MQWPQIVIVALFMWRLVNAFMAMARDRSMSSGTATVAVFVALGLLAAEAAVLHAGGFW